MIARTTRIKTLRGDILQFLYNLNGTTVAEKSIVQAYYEYYTIEDINKALAYLVESRHIIREERQHPIFTLRKESFYRIAASGMNIVEGDLADPGICVMPELKEADR
ncbi:MAG: hypothetical protein ACTTJZ_00830 [Sphaerochaetaceae bacterium]